MSDLHVMLKPKRTAVSTTLTRFFMLLAVSLSLASCGSGNRVEVTLRADAVEPPAPVDVMFSLDGREESRTEVQPGQLIELGSVDTGTVVVFQVTNSRGAGQVRANILIDNCFRATARCLEPDCIARATYAAAAEECAN